MHNSDKLFRMFILEQDQLLPRVFGNRVENGQMKKSTAVDDKIQLNHAQTQQLVC